jgi:cysteinyl-tRNA synthetase
MNQALNGETFDIHAGGEDLIFPHHENEIAQSVCAHGGKPYANYWMHNGMLNVDARKMSKSLGNVFLVHDLIGKLPGEVIRLTLLSAHYRQPLDWTDETVSQMKATLDRYYGILRDTGDIAPASGVAAPDTLVEALADDLNTPRALAELAQAAKQLSTAKTSDEKAAAKAALLDAGLLMGLLTQDPVDWFHAGAGLGEDEINLKIAARVQAKKDKNFALADQIRQDLADQGILIEDTPQGTKWKKAG